MRPTATRLRHSRLADGLRSDHKRGGASDARRSTSMPYLLQNWRSSVLALTPRAADLDRQPPNTDVNRVTPQEVRSDACRPCDEGPMMGCERIHAGQHLSLVIISITGARQHAGSTPLRRFFCYRLAVDGNWKHSGDLDDEGLATTGPSFFTYLLLLRTIRMRDSSSTHQAVNIHHVCADPREFKDSGTTIHRRMRAHLDHLVRISTFVPV
jgi:hypothetical protein